MKFLCPSCKAKYQISDDKVSGRAVRMKCRKCGTIIPISQVPPAPLTVPPPGGDALPPVPRMPPAPRDLAPPPSSRPPIVTPPPPRVAPVRTGPTAARGVPLRAAPGLAPVATPAVAKVVPKIEKAPPVRTGDPVRTGELLSALDDDEEQQTAIVSGGALAAAFGAHVTAAQPSKPTNDQVMPADEWYVGINDVPVGPIRLAELRAKAASGAILGDSLVWRDGLEEWRPLRTFPELIAVVEESLSSVRAAGAPLPVAIDGVVRTEIADFVTPPPGGVTGVGVVTDDLAAAGLTRPRTPVAAWIAIALALACGVAIGVFVLGRQKPPETIVKYVDRVVPGAEQPLAPGAQDPAVDVAPGAGGSGTKSRPSGPRTGVKSVAANGDNGDKGGLSGLKGLDGLRPSGGPGPGSAPGTTTPTSGGGQLDAAQTQAVVARYTGSVKRSCWQPALDSRDPSAPTSARVLVTITVGPNGSVQNATTNGEPRGYPGLSSCIAGRVRGWQFPATGSTTTVNVPFVFAAQ